MAQALSHVRVLELADYQAGPHAGMILADLGAEVIKIESPAGNFTRQSVGGHVNGESIYFASANRNKRGIVLDLHHEAGRDTVRRLAAKCDVVLDNFRPGVMTRMGLDYDALAAINARIVCCSISGFGSDGPYRDRPGYDYLLQGWAGVAHMIGEDGGSPRTTRLSVVDLLGGVYGALGVLAALQQRERTGVGQFVDISLLDAAWSLLHTHIATHLATGQVPVREPNSAHPDFAPSQIFPTSDSFIVVIAVTDRFFGRLCAGLDLPDLATDDRFISASARAQNRRHLVHLLEERFRQRPTSDWVDLLTALDVPVAPVNDLPNALADPQVRHRGAVVECVHPVAGPLQIFGNPIKLSGHDQQYLPSPLLGEHTRLVLSSILGVDDEQVEAVVADGGVTSDGSTSTP